MFSVDCSRHGTEVLLTERRIRAIVPVEGGSELHWTCWCGTEGATFVARVTAAEHMVGRHRPAV